MLTPSDKIKQDEEVDLSIVVPGTTCHNQLLSLAYNEENRLTPMMTETIEVNKNLLNLSSRFQPYYMLIGMFSILRRS